MTFLDRFRRPTPPSDHVPPSCPYSDEGVATLADAAPAGRPMLGLAAHGRAVYAPHGHLLVTDGTGGGRSTVLRAVGAQALRDGHRLVVIDYKRRSHGWCRDLTGVTYPRTVAEVHTALECIGRELTQGPQPTTILFEEVGLTLHCLEGFWHDAGHHGRSAATLAFLDVLLAGRAAGVRVVGSGHILTPRVVPPEARSNVAQVLGSRLPASTWRSLGLERPRDLPSRPGRYHLVGDGIHQPFQALHVSASEAARIAADGREVAY